MVGLAPIVIVLPSLKVSGGVKEAIRLGRELAAAGAPVRVLAMWRSPHPVDAPGLDVVQLSNWPTRPRSAALQLPALYARFRRHFRLPGTGRGNGPAHCVFTHYSSFPLALAVPRQHRWFFVQDLEWMFLPPGVVRRLLQRIVLAFYRRGRVLAANAYLSSELHCLGIAVEAEAPIWADPAFRSPHGPDRDIDVVMVLRKGDHKRLDMYVALIERARALAPSLVLAVITPETQVAEAVRGSVRHCWLRPDIDAMRAIYERSRCFLHLSEHEGFGLPPLEAMGAGCVPLCRDSGGIRAYMVGPLSELVLPLDWPVNRIVEGLNAVLSDRPAWAAYSAAARQIFDDGLQRARSRGAALSALLTPSPRHASAAP